MSKLWLILSVALFAAPASAQECPRLPGTVRLSAVGDILIHKPLYEIAVTDPRKFRSLWGDLAPVLAAADFTIGNLEGPVAPGVTAGGLAARDPGLVYDGRVYSGTDFVFNYHPRLLADLKTDGFDLLTTANNHTMDRGSLGVDRTIEQLKLAGLEFAGTVARGSGESSERIVEAGGFRLGIISCAEMLNGNPDPAKQTTRCAGDTVPQMIARLRARADAVLVFPHWGDEYVPANSAQKKLARQWVAAGAAAIVGNHPHVLQQSEWLGRPGGGRALVIYSLGNFIACMKDMPRRVTAVAHLDLAREATGVEVAQFSYTPAYRPSGSVSLKKLSPKTNPAEWAHARAQLGLPVCR